MTVLSITGRKSGTKKSVKPDRRIQTRWGGDDILWQDGFVAVPVSFLRSLNSMTPFKLTPVEAMFILQLMSYKWSAANPFPGYKRVAKDMGITDVYARRVASNLEKKRFLRRIRRVGSSNEFDLNPLFARLAAHLRPAVPGKKKRPSTKVGKSARSA